MPGDGLPLSDPSADPEAWLLDEIARAVIQGMTTDRPPEYVARCASEIARAAEAVAAAWLVERKRRS